MKKKLDFKNFSIYFDQYLFIAITLLSVMGLFFLYSASQEDINTVAKQAIFVGFGLLLMFVVSQPDPDFYNTFSGLFLIFSLVLIFLTMIFGKEINGAKRWLDLGFFTLQSSEIIKISLPIFLSSYLYNKPLPISTRHTFITLILIGFIFALVARQPDLGTSLVVFMSGGYVLFLAGLSWRFIGSAIALFLLSLPFLWNNFLEPFQQQRVLTYLNPDADPYGTAWNITQSKIAIGSGGINGKGYQEGSQAHLDFLPETETDFIFAVYSEEFGFFGVVIIFALFLLLIFRIFILANNMQSTFSKLLTVSLGVSIFSAIFVNIAMISGLVPIVGLPLPFMSYGGTSMVVSLASIGIIMSLNNHKTLIAN